MKRLTIVLGTSGLIIIGILTFIALDKRTPERLRRLLVASQWKKFEDLDIVDKTVLSNDSVYGDYLQWTGKQYLGPGIPDTITRKLFLDKPNKFAIKIIFKDTTGFFTKFPGDISYSGQWTEQNQRLTLKFYFVPETWSQLFDSLKNDKIMKFIDGETIEIDKNAETIWIMDTECKKIK